jgi:hypothetical protein
VSVPPRRIASKKLRRRDLDAFLARGWGEIAEPHADHWKTWSADESLRISDELRRSAQLLRPGWPSAAEREADLASHTRVAEIFRRIHAKQKRRGC